MSFDFDTFINQVCVGTSDQNGEIKAGIFGKVATYTPLRSPAMSFKLAGDFHKDYQKSQPESLDETVITSESIRFVVRLHDFPKRYPKPQQGDVIRIGLLRFDIMDIREHIPGSQTLFLHETI